MEHILRFLFVLLGVIGIAYGAKIIASGRVNMATMIGILGYRRDYYYGKSAVAIGVGWVMLSGAILGCLVFPQHLILFIMFGAIAWNLAMIFAWRLR